MTIEPERPFNARIVPTCVALALIAAGAALRLAGAWLVNRGVGACDYGIAFYNRKAQADAIVGPLQARTFARPVTRARSLRRK
jgi:hypothetical protein